MLQQCGCANQPEALKVHDEFLHRRIIFHFRYALDAFTLHSIHAYVWACIYKPVWPPAVTQAPPWVWDAIQEDCLPGVPAEQQGIRRVDGTKRWEHMNPCPACAPRQTVYKMLWQLYTGVACSIQATVLTVDCGENSVCQALWAGRGHVNDWQPKASPDTALPKWVWEGVDQARGDHKCGNFCVFGVNLIKQQWRKSLVSLQIWPICDKFMKFDHTNYANSLWDCKKLISNVTNSWPTNTWRVLRNDNMKISWPWRKIISWH